MVRTRSSESASVRSRIAAWRPLASTSTRSARSTTSSSSDETMTMAMPSSARRRMTANISPLAPTSMPRVGSSISRTRGRRCSHLATTSFCWLPPESVPVGAPRRRGSKASDFAMVSAAALRRPLRTMAPGARPRMSVMVTLTKPFWLSTRPSPLRSSGASAMPSAERPADGARQGLGAAVHDERSRGAGLGAGQRAQELGPAGAHQPRDAEDLAGVEGEGDVLELAGHRDAVDAQELLAPGRARRRALRRAQLRSPAWR